MIGMRPVAEILTLSGCTSQEDMDVVNDLPERQRAQFLERLCRKHCVSLKDYQIIVFARPPPRAPSTPGYPQSRSINAAHPVSARFWRPALQDLATVLRLAGLDNQADMDVFDTLSEDAIVDMIVKLCPRYGIRLKDYMPLVAPFMRKSQL